MKIKNQTLLIVVISAIAVWWFFLRKPAKARLNIAQGKPIRIITEKKDKCPTGQLYSKLPIKGVINKNAVLYESFVKSREVLPSGYIKIISDIRKTNKILPKGKIIKIGESGLTKQLPQDVWQTRINRNFYFVLKNDIENIKYKEFCEPIFKTYS